MTLLQIAMREKALRNAQETSSELPNRSPPSFQDETRKIWLVGAAGILLVVIVGVLMLNLPQAKESAPVAAAPAPVLIAPMGTSSSRPPADTAPQSEVGQLVAAVAPEQAVQTAIDGWVAAWAARDVENYLAHYVADYKPAKGLSHAQWVKQRRERLGKYRQIEVVLSEPKITLNGDSATADFIQEFKGDTYSETGVQKRLVLKQVGGQWLIVEESSV